MIFPTITRPGMGLINFKPPPKRVSKRGASRPKFKADPTEQLLSLHRTEATPPQNSQIPPSGVVGDVSHMLGDEMFRLDGFCQIDLLGANTWSDECLSYSEDLMAPALTPLSPAGEVWSDEVLDPPPLKLITGQPCLTGSKGEVITADNVDNVSTQPIPELSEQHELHFITPSRALNLITSPSLNLPEFTEEWLQLLHTGSLPPQALCQIAPAATTGVHSSSPTQQHCCNTRRYTDTEIPGQYGDTNVWNMTNILESQTSVSEITNNAVKRISFPAPAPFYVQLPSPQPTEQTSQHETSPPKTPLPTATLSATLNGPRRSTRINTIATKSGHHQLGPEKPAPLKRLSMEINADGDAMNDSSGACTAKRPRTVHSSTPVGRTAHPLKKRRLERRSPLPTSEDKPGNMTLMKPLRQPLTRMLAESPGANQQELSRPQSLRDSTPRGDNRKVHGHGRLQGPGARPAKPIDLETSREIPTDDCRACGFCAEHLFQLTEMAWRWIPKDDASFEALFESDFGFSDTEKSAIMLRLCLGSIREYAREMATVGRQPGHPLQPTMTLPEYTKTEKIISGQSDSLSDASNDDDGDDLSEGIETDGDSDITDGVGSKRNSQARGKAHRWSPLEERRLRSYLKEKKDWSWIAGQLGRTENAVKQHWGKMS
ncbi:hypothetical protein B0H67DRAFT_558335 [Lasiosphaeris hirsuta]|uniref:Myb-like domain-containing protein n=1 Tax=Lasiosphaeris hirsuta TaxID=260670 RepID=A0AA39ZSH4_9PEZI|nr:hypothetical protein B0H67DRAFT_558335 [Lasiosphaeris hirsuta]